MARANLCRKCWNIFPHLKARSYFKVCNVLIQNGMQTAYFHNCKGRISFRIRALLYYSGLWSFNTYLLCEWWLVGQIFHCNFLPIDRQTDRLNYRSSLVEFKILCRDRGSYQSLRFDSTILFRGPTDRPTDGPAQWGIEAPSRSLKISPKNHFRKEISCTRNILWVFFTRPLI